VVSVTTYRDAGFLPQAFVNFVVLLGWSPKNDREVMSIQELIDAFDLSGVNRSNAMINFAEDDPFDPKAIWLNAEHIRTMPVEELTRQLAPFAPKTEKLAQIAPLIQERIKLLRDVNSVADFFFVDELPPYDVNELIPQKGDRALAKCVLEEARSSLAGIKWNHDEIDRALRAGAERLHVKTGQMFQPVRVAVCGRKVAPPLFETLAVLGRETSLTRIVKAIEML
jgi:glutamyl-tRNA synthetase